MNWCRNTILLFLPVVALAQGDPPSEMLDKLESRLLTAKRVRVEASIEATGALQASVKGFTEVLDRNRAKFKYTGTFAGKPLDVTLDSTGTELVVSNGKNPRTEAVGAESNRAVLLGFTRMGLLHNIARATEPAGPDHATGGVTPWIMPDNFQPVTFAQIGPLAGMPSLGFSVLVEKKPAATTRLWFNPDTGLPHRREQTVQFPSGEMVVVETYNAFLVE